MLDQARRATWSSSVDPAADALQPVAELSFLAEVAHLVATARTWEELMDTVIERTKAAARADVCSLYLTDRDGSGLTLAATNGLDQHAVGVARLEMGHGHHRYRRRVTPDHHQPGRQ